MRHTGQQLFMENKMQSRRYQSVLAPLWRQRLLHPAGVVLAVALVIGGLNIGLAPGVDAQPAKPAASGPAPVYIPAVPFRNRNRFPPYPKDSFELGEEGTVGIKLIVSVNGRVSDIRVVKSSGSPRLDRATALWIKSRWRYHPAMLNNVPVASTIAFNVTFVLKK